jgi:hypothetical protein
MVKGKETSIIFLQVHRLEDIVFKSSISFSCKRLLKEDVEEFIVQEAENVPVKNKIMLSIESTDVMGVLNEDKITAIVHNHFAYREKKTEQQLANILRLGWENLLIAFAFLVAMFFLTKALVALLPEGGLILMLRELFIILGWVALWRPADLLLYEWRPYKRKAKLLGRLSQCNIQFQKVFAQGKEN